MDNDKYRHLFKDVESMHPNTSRTFCSTYFFALKMAPDLAGNISAMNGGDLYKLLPPSYTTVEFML